MEVGELVCAACNTIECRYCPNRIRANNVGAKKLEHVKYAAAKQMCDDCTHAGKRSRMVLHISAWCATKNVFAENPMTERCKQLTIVVGHCDV